MNIWEAFHQSFSTLRALNLSARFKRPVDWSLGPRCRIWRWPLSASHFRELTVFSHFTPDVGVGEGKSALAFWSRSICVRASVRFIGHFATPS